MGLRFSCPRRAVAAAETDGTADWIIVGETPTVSPVVVVLRRRFAILAPPALSLRHQPIPLSVVCARARARVGSGPAVAADFGSIVELYLLPAPGQNNIYTR